MALMCPYLFQGPIWGPSNVFTWFYSFVKLESMLAPIKPLSLSSPTHPPLHLPFCRVVLERPWVVWDSAKGKSSWRATEFGLRRLYLCGLLSHLVKLLLAILVQEWLLALFLLPTLAMPGVILQYEHDLLHWALKVYGDWRRNKLPK